MSIKTRATIEDLYKVEGKAELVKGEIVLMSPTGGVPGRAAGKIYRRLAEHEEHVGGGYAFPDNVGFTVNLPHRGDVDVLRQQVIRVYRASDPDNPTIYRRGDIAEAEPAVPGWRMPVNDLFG